MKEQIEATAKRDQAQDREDKEKQNRMIYSNQVVASQKFDEVIDKLKTVQETMNNKFDEEAKAAEEEAKAAEEAKGLEEIRGSDNASHSVMKHSDVVHRVAPQAPRDDG